MLNVSRFGRLMYNASNSFVYATSTIRPSAAKVTANATRIVSGQLSVTGISNPSLTGNEITVSSSSFTGVATASFYGIGGVYTDIVITAKATFTATPFRIRGGVSSPEGFAKADFTATGHQVAAPSAIMTGEAVLEINAALVVDGPVIVFTGFSMPELTANTTASGFAQTMGKAELRFDGNRIADGFMIALALATGSAVPTVYSWDEYKEPVVVEWAASDGVGTVWTDTQNAPNPWRDKT